MRWINLKTKYTGKPVTWTALIAFAFMVCVLPFMHHHGEAWLADGQDAAAFHAPGLYLQSLQPVSHKHGGDDCIACHWGLNTYQRSEAAASSFTPPAPVYSICIRADHQPGAVDLPCAGPRAPPQSIS